MKTFIRSENDHRNRNFLHEHPELLGSTVTNTKKEAVVGTTNGTMNIL